MTIGEGRLNDGSEVLVMCSSVNHVHRMKRTAPSPDA